ncbi:hypothetical protein N7449_003851 [Penicillium cf. viridicatum]|uniref:Uncharacterized protein n=1 Tax=Penicillium cf. viridicatum TaxID=2972119 RepID=A0A9W9MXR7_9EURO|nr:hypothetical protein N7449_003851 [Penicillium cf. viridicatum]
MTCSNSLEVIMFSSSFGDWDLLHQQSPSVDIPVAAIGGGATESTVAAETEKKRLRAQVTGLEQHIRGTGGQVRDSVGRLPITGSYADPCSPIEAPVVLAKDWRYQAGTWQP